MREFCLLQQFSPKMRPLLSFLRTPAPENSPLSQSHNSNVLQLPSSPCGQCQTSRQAKVAQPSRPLLASSKSRANAFSRTLHNTQALCAAASPGSLVCGSRLRQQAGLAGLPVIHCCVWSDCMPCHTCDGSSRFAISSSPSQRRCRADAARAALLQARAARRSLVRRAASGAPG